MATAKELRVWAASIRRWATMIDDTRVAEHAASLAAELDNLAARKEVETGNSSDSTMRGPYPAWVSRPTDDVAR